MIITIDGPAGAGKSSVSKLLAGRLGFQFLDTGAMYRAVTWAALKKKVDLDDPEALQILASQLQVAFADNEVVVDGDLVTDAIRSDEVTLNVSAIADSEGVREQMVVLQREFAKYGNYVCEGRDQGTVVFPNAKCKFYLTASAEKRAQRRVEQIRNTGQDADFDELLKQQNDRDHRDFNRPVGRLMKADDAVEVDTDDKSLNQVTDELEKIAREKLDLKT